MTLNEREAFKAYLKTKGILKIDWNCLGVITNVVREAGCTLGYNDLELMQEVWEAKAQAVPEGYVFVPKEPTEKMLKRGNRLALSDSQYRYDAASIYEVMLEASESGAEG